MKWKAERPRSFADFELARERWSTFGWRKVPPSDEPAIKSNWIAHLEGTKGIVQTPKPNRCWWRISIAELGDRAEEVEADFTLKILTAFRNCIPLGEHMLAIDWQHSWYYFDPHGAIVSAIRDEWAMPVLPDGDSYNYVTSDFRVGVLTGWDQNWSIRLFGAELLTSFAKNPPESFLRACGPGEVVEQH
jgi:hypothetical protein